MRRLATAVTIAAAVVLISPPGWSHAAPSQTPPGRVGVGLPNPPNRPEKGLVYDGLERTTDGRCGGQFRLVRTGRCTHGPDVGPAGIDVSSHMAPSLDIADKTPPGQCTDDGVSGKRTQVIYARASDVADRFVQYLPSFRQWATSADDAYAASAAETGGMRRIRFVRDASCLISVEKAVIPPAADDDFDSTIAALQSLGYTSANRKFMVFVDANVYCGIGNIEDDDQPGAANANNGGPSYGRIDAGCWNGGTVAHEHMHNLGGVQNSAPHSSGGWHCVDEYDLMCYSDEPNFPAMQILCPNGGGFDCKHDDYYHTNPEAGSYLATKWNAANSQYLLKTGAPLYDNFSSRMSINGANGTMGGTSVDSTKGRFA